ncbi:tetratricopeptide repeat-containing diguanylate cyclase [Frateuria terrea]|uniref:diguanylate cyclase n=1 Tax=Frateuria terrea TaxID=529704 RepID=A0A1H6QK38_9GAMM|nr:GGDEF domain-containing protein [Frateuria terrea]SEI43953.1 diguanylate cyclase (GGDEF) domain-containing protein [Frateuria terrea]SFP09403.1 diguanylate cyclase (GGDEF) domain-containing protein [Frateuria terrea]
MSWSPSRIRVLSAWVGLAWCVLAPACHAGSPITDPGSFMQQAEGLRTKDHPQFLAMLARIHREAPHLTPAEQWQLRYLDAWEAMFQGDYTKSEPELRQIVDHSGNEVLTAKASGLLLNDLALTRRYEDAFTLANRLAAGLGQVKDPRARFLLVSDLSQMLNLAGQIDLAIQYARMAEQAVPPGENLCRPLSREVAALFNGKRLTSTSPELQRAIDTCEAAGQPVFTNAMRLVLGSLYMEEGEPAVALALLDRLAPGIRNSKYYPHILSSQVERAQALAALGRDNEARKAALAAIALAKPDSIDEWLAEAYEVLYRVEKRQGNAAAALLYYERYVVQDKGYLDDVSARALAYEVAQQHILAQKLETERLGKQNKLLRLQQALDTKAVETSRLYNLLLLVVIASIVLWLLRLKRSQLRFKKLSRQDSLTGILNHQHFVGQSGRALHALERRVGHACLIVFDLDHFKRVNDTHGHAMGDAVLKRAVAACQQQLRPSDLFGRLGGEEFGVLLHECSRHQGMEIANRIRAAIADAAVQREDCVITVSASVGLAATDTSGYELQRLCKEADAALYRAKRAGRNCVMGDIEVDVVLARA